MEVTHCSCGLTTGHSNGMTAVWRRVRSLPVRSRWVRVIIMVMMVAGVMRCVGQRLAGTEARGCGAGDLANTIAMFSDEIAGEQDDGDSDDDLDESDHGVNPVCDRWLKLTCGASLGEPSGEV